MNRLSRAALAAGLVASCDGGREQRVAATPPEVARVTDAHSAAGDAGTPRAPDPGPPVDPGVFQRFGCATDAAPPHIATGTASVTWRPAGPGGFSFRNLPARCGSAYPGQLIDGARSRPGDGVEFVVCMPDERRLDVGILRRGAVPAGPQDVTHTPGLVRLRLMLDRFVNAAAPAAGSDAGVQLTFGPRLRSASGSVPLSAASSSAVAGTVEFQIDCGR